MKKIAFLLLAVVFTCQAGNAQVIKSDGSFFFIAPHSPLNEGVVKKTVTKKQKLTFSVFSEDGYTKWKSRPFSGIPGDTIRVVQFSAQKIFFQTGDSVATSKPSRVYMFEKDFEEFKKYHKDHLRDTCYLIAPAMRYRYGFLRLKGAGNPIPLVTNYGCGRSLEDLSFIPHEGDTNVGYIPFEKTVVYFSTMYRWKGSHMRRAVPLEIYQTSVVTWDSTSVLIAGRKINGISVSTEVVSLDTSFFPATEHPLVVSFEPMLLVEGFTGPLPLDASPFENETYEYNDEDSRQVNYIHTISSIGDKQAKKGSVSVSKSSSFVEKKEVPSSIKSGVVTLEPLISLLENTVTVSWSSIPEATQYIVRLYYGDGTYNTKYVTDVAPVIFKNVSSGEKCRVVVTAKKDSKVIASEERTFTM